MSLNETPAPQTQTPAPASHNTALRVWRVLFMAIFVILGGYAGAKIGDHLSQDSYYGEALHDSRVNQTAAEVAFAILGVLVTYLLSSAAFNRLVQIGERVKQMQTSEKIATFIGALLGLLLTLIITTIFKTPAGISFLVGIALVYLSVVATTSMKDDIRLYVPAPAADKDDEGEKGPVYVKILDTNVIIDGRVADICRAGFIEGPVYVPGFVVDELQHIADSPDNLKRARGRRGLDILNQMKSEMELIVRTLDSEVPEREEVDSRLVKLAKKINGKIVTNDFNLNKVAELQGVSVLNINELANALKPVVLPGEVMSVTVIKEGKEMNQGVAYLDDGTMIVVEGGRRRIGETVEVVTSSVLQTAAGKMIFATIRSEDDESEEGDYYDRNLRAYPRSGPRRKIQY